MKKTLKYIVITLILASDLVFIPRKISAEEGESFLDKMKSGLQSAGMAALTAFLSQVSSNPALLEALPIGKILALASAAGIPIPPALASMADPNAVKDLTGTATALGAGALQSAGVSADVTNTLTKVAQAAETGDLAVVEAAAITSGTKAATETLQSAGVSTDVTDALTTVAQAAETGDLEKVEAAAITSGIEEGTKALVNSTGFSEDQANTLTTDIATGNVDDLQNQALEAGTQEIVAGTDTAIDTLTSEAQEAQDAVQKNLDEGAQKINDNATAAETFAGQEAVDGAENLNNDIQSVEGEEAIQ